MEKKLVQVYVPAIDFSVDAFLPNGLSVDEAVKLLSEAVEAVSLGFFRRTGNEILCVERLNMVLIPGTTIDTYGIMNADKLILI